MYTDNTNNMGKTTVSMDPKTRDKVKSLKGPHRSYDEMLNVFVEQYDPEKDDNYEVTR